LGKAVWGKIALVRALQTQIEGDKSITKRRLKRPKNDAPTPTSKMKLKLGQRHAFILQLIPQEFGDISRILEANVPRSVGGIAPSKWFSTL